MSFLRFVAKSGCSPLITRQLSLQSMACLTRSSSPKLLATNACIHTTNTNNGSLDGRQPLLQRQLLQQLSTRLLSSSASGAAAQGSHNHSKLWSLERYVSLGLLGVIPAALAVPNPALDYLLALSLVIHVHWGLEAIVVDYIRPSIFGSVVAKLMVAYVYMLSIAALAGLFYFNYTDVGLGVAIRMAAKI
ncbi:unnamed protein product [Oppiella nova]|uniref:Succinate dehydrogenase [ubiquinone] cytochrome b small subunit n=1 Tax=Oppiella nova TaxID=334625 RepID=A0A7R9QZA2_9ACAR|nr:unnamed protein product [Oppiella nova]CAG2180385.1 unnamed protein product [Oppiella nova]